MSKKKIPGSREEDSWFTEDQLEGLELADEHDDLRSPIPTQVVSNGEYVPGPQTLKQKEVEHRIKELAAHAAKKLGVSRRKFLASSGGIAASFIAMNEAYGAEFFKVSKDEVFEPQAHAKNAPPSDLFVLDDQLHTIRSSQKGPGNTLRSIAEGIPSSLNRLNLPDELGGVNTPWNPALVGLPNDNINFQLVQFMKDVYLDAQTTIGILSNNTSAAIPDVGTSRPPRNVQESEAGEFLSATQTMSVRDWVNDIAGSTRMLGHGQLFPGLGNQHDPVYEDYHRWQIENLKPDSWKGYTSANSTKHLTPDAPGGTLDPLSGMTRWRLDDEVSAYPMYAVLTEARYREYARTHPGFYNICIHKGLSTGSALTDAAGTPIGSSSVPLGLPDDIPKAARDWPQLNFLIYHSCIKSGFWMGSTKGTTSGGQPTPPGAYDDLLAGNLLNGVPNIHWTTQFLQTSAPFRNVFAELGTTFASCIVTFPSLAAHLLGQMLKYFGEDRIVFGSDSVWYGSPQWQIEAMWRFQIPDVFPSQDANGNKLPGGTRAGWGYPQLTETAKRKILGLNNGRLYGIKNVDGKLTNDPDACEDKNKDNGRYHPVPVNFESLIPISLKRTMEFDGYAMDDNLSKMRREYLAMGGVPNNVRHGWIRRG
jgi:uncharacterized protein